MGKSLYLEASSGIAGDMFVAALLDLGADRKALDKAISSIPAKGFTVEIGRVQKAGIDCCDFNVILDKEHETMTTTWPISTAPCRKQGKRFMKNTTTIMRKKAIIMRRKNITATAMKKVTIMKSTTATAMKKATITRKKSTTVTVMKTITIMTMERDTIIMNTAI